MGNEGSISNSEKSDLTLLSRQLRWCVSKCLGGEADSQYVRACQMSLPSVSKKVNTKNSSSLKNRGERETSATHPTLQLLDKIASFAGIWHHSGDAVSKDDQRSHTEGSIHVHLHHHHYHHYQEQVGSGIVSSSRTSSTVNSRRVPSSAECSTSAASLGWGFGPLWEKVKAVVSSVASANGRSDLQQRIAVEAAVALPGYIIHHCNLGNSILPENFRLGGISIDMTRSHRHRLNSDHIKDAMAPLLLNLYHSKFNRDIFNRPVDPVALNIPDYPSVIERPMDLGTIRSKMERGLYSTLLALRADVELVFSNAMLYNAAYHPVHKLAENLLAQFQSEYFKAAAKFNQLYRRSFRHTCAHCHDGMTCALCHMKCLRLEHSSVACDGPCGGRVARSAYYFVELSTNKTWCVKCHSRMRMSSPDGTPHSKRRNNNVYAEPWVHCSICKNWYHQACVLFNPWKEGVQKQYFPSDPPPKITTKVSRGATSKKRAKNTTSRTQFQKDNQIDSMNIDDNIQKKITSKSYRRKTKKLKSMEEKSPKINLDNSDTFGPKYRNNKLKRTSSNVSIESKSSQTSAVQQPQCLFTFVCPSCRPSSDFPPYNPPRKYSRDEENDIMKEEHEGSAAKKSKKTNKRKSPPKDSSPKKTSPKKIHPKNTKKISPTIRKTPRKKSKIVNKQMDIDDDQVVLHSNYKDDNAFFDLSKVCVDKSNKKYRRFIADDLPTDESTEYGASRGIASRLNKKLLHFICDLGAKNGLSINESKGLSDTITIKLICNIDHENPVSEEIRDIMESMSSLRKRQYLAQENESKANSEKKIYNTNVVPSSFTCRTKTLLVFQKIDGIDVLLFAAYFNEFGSESPEPNRRVVYLDYIDSVNLLSPRWLRTPLYQMILTEYLASAKERGFSAMHIWACPPLRGTDYIFHRHPRDQRTPGWDRLRQWYSSMLVSAQKDGSVVEVQSLYADHFDGLVPLRPNHNPPFLPGHFWLQSALELIKKDSIVRSKGKRKAKRILSTTNIRVGSSTTKTDEAPRKKSRITRISEETSIDQPSDTSHITGDKSFSTASDCDAILPEILPSSTLLSEQATSTMHGMSEVKEEEKEEIRESRLKYLQTKTFTEELRTKIGSMAERLLVVRLQPICGDCGDYIHENFGKGHESYICMGSCCAENSKKLGIDAALGLKSLKVKNPIHSETQDSSTVRSSPRLTKKKIARQKKEAEKAAAIASANIAKQPQNRRTNPTKKKTKGRRKSSGGNSTDARNNRLAKCTADVLSVAFGTTPAPFHLCSKCFARQKKRNSKFVSSSSNTKKTLSLIPNKNRDGYWDTQRSLYHKGPFVLKKTENGSPAKNKKDSCAIIKKSTIDFDIIRPCPLLEVRRDLLHFWSSNHLQFDTIRRAKWSTMLFLDEVMNNFSSDKSLVCTSSTTSSTVYNNSFVILCESCRVPILNGVCWTMPDTRTDAGCITSSSNVLDDGKPRICYNCMCILNEIADDVKDLPPLEIKEDIPLKIVKTGKNAKRKVNRPRPRIFDLTSTSGVNAELAKKNGILGGLNIRTISIKDLVMCSLKVSPFQLLLKD